MTLRIIGDVHCHFDQYLEVIHNAEYSIQIGDFDFDYSRLTEVDPKKHKIIKGNHDNHDDNSWPHFLTKFGFWEHGGHSFFHMQGAFSIDWKQRVEHEMLLNNKVWWPNEQLSYHELTNAVELYKWAKPDLVITHDAPREIVNTMFDSRVLQNWGYDPATFTTHTSEALQEMFEFHQPKRWFFGHYHKTRTLEYKGTTFQCLAELNYMDI